MKAEAIIFDLDGTLLNTIADLARSANEVLKLRNHPIHDVEAYNFFVGNGLYNLFQVAVKEGSSHHEIEQCCDLFNEIYEKGWHEVSHPYAGINDTLQQLRNYKIKLAILSNKPDGFTRKCVEHFWGDGFFEYYFGQRKNIPRKPDPHGIYELSELLSVELDKILYVGDSSTDMQTGKNAGVFTIGVSWGFRAAEELKQNSADIIINEPLELLQYAGII